MDYIIRGIPADHLDKFWPHGEAYVKRALEHANGEMTHKDVRLFCEERSMQLWFIYGHGRIVGAATTELINYPQMRVARVVTLSGQDFDAWGSLLDDILGRWAGEQGCHGMEAYTRMGFKKKLEKLGYKNKYAAMFREIKE